MFIFSLRVSLLVLTGLLMYIKLVLFCKNEPYPHFSASDQRPNFCSRRMWQTSHYSVLSSEHKFSCTLPSMMVQCQPFLDISPGKKKKEEEQGHSQDTKSFGDSLAFLLLMGLWLCRRTPSPTGESWQRDFPTPLLPHISWPIFQCSLGSVPWGWGGFAAAPTLLMPKTGYLHLHCLHTKVGLIDLKPAVQGSQAFLASRRQRSRCVSVIMHVHIINLCIPVNLDMCWTYWINFLCSTGVALLCPSSGAAVHAWSGYQTY